MELTFSSFNSVADFQLQKLQKFVKIIFPNFGKRNFKIKIFNLNSNQDLFHKPIDLKDFCSKCGIEILKSQASKNEFIEKDHNKFLFLNYYKNLGT